MSDVDIFASNRKQNKNRGDDLCVRKTVSVSVCRTVTRRRIKSVTWTPVTRHAVVLRGSNCTQMDNAIVKRKDWQISANWCSSVVFITYSRPLQCLSL